MHNFNDVFFCSEIFFLTKLLSTHRNLKHSKKTPSFEFHRICMGCKTNALHWRCLHGLGGSAANHNEPCPNVASYLHCIAGILILNYFEEREKTMGHCEQCKKIKILLCMYFIRNTPKKMQTSKSKNELIQTQLNRGIKL